MPAATDRPAPTGSLLLLFETTHAAMEAEEQIINSGFWCDVVRSEEHTSELQSHSFISYAVFCLKKKNKKTKKNKKKNKNNKNTSIKFGIM